MYDSDDPERSGVGAAHFGWRGCAVKTTKLNSRLRREKSGETLLGHRPYPKTKVDGDQSMTEKQGTGAPCQTRGPARPA